MPVTITAFKVCTICDDSCFSDLSKTRLDW